MTDSELSKIYVTWSEIVNRVRDQADPLRSDIKIWGIPRGGVYVAGIWATLGFEVVETAWEADFAVDDIIDTGRTAKEVFDLFKISTFAAFNKQEDDKNLPWVVFPWEVGEGPEKYIREEPIRTWDNKVEIEYKKIKCPRGEDHLTLIVRTGVDKDKVNYATMYQCREDLSVWSMSPENPIFWAPSQFHIDSWKKEQERGTVKLSPERVTELLKGLK